jgi:hypothetical protein
MQGIFINYRREDSIAYAGRIYDRIGAHFGKDRVFMDIDAIDPGEDFVEAIEHTCTSTGVFLVLIGKSWATITDRTGKRRLDNPNDFVRLEIARGLARGVRVIPVLLDDAEMPGPDVLPEDLQKLAYRNAIQISSQRFHHDIDRLIDAITKGLAKSEPHAVPEEPARPRSAEVIGSGFAVSAPSALQPAAPPLSSSSAPVAAPVEQLTVPQSVKLPVPAIASGQGSKRLALGLILGLVAFALVVSVGIWIAYAMNRPAAETRSSTSATSSAPTASTQPSPAPASSQPRQTQVQQSPVQQPQVQRDAKPKNVAASTLTSSAPARNPVQQAPAPSAAPPPAYQPPAPQPSAPQPAPPVSSADNQPNAARLATVMVVYSGDNLACSLDLNVQLGDRKFHPTANQVRLTGMPLGAQRYEIAGRIGCPYRGVCTASGSGSLNVRDGSVFHVVWRNTSYGKCSIGLVPE